IVSVTLHFNKQMHMRRLITLLTILGFQFSVNAQNGTLEGRVLDANSNEKLSGISLQIIETNTSAATDVDGNFNFVLPAGKTYTLQVTGVGYQTKVLESIHIEANQTNNLVIVLNHAA